MKYKKAQDILPQYMIDDLQQYIEGGYIYIPKKEENKKNQLILKALEEDEMEI